MKQPAVATAATALIAKTAAAVTRKAVASARFIRNEGNRRASRAVDEHGISPQNRRDWGRQD